MVSTSWVKTRRGILDHLKEHKVNSSQFAVFQLLILLADKATGVVWIDAPLIVSQYFHDMPMKTAQTALAVLKAKGYIKSFQQQGSRGSYPVLINKYEISVGGLKGGLTNAEQTVDWRHPVISERTEDGSENRSEVGSEPGSEDGTPYSSPQVPNSSKPRHQSDSADQNATMMTNSKTGKPTEPHTPLPEMVKQIIAAYPMTPFNQAVERKWSNVILAEIENMIPPNGLWADRDIAADWILHQVKCYAQYRTPKQGWALDKFINDGHYDRDWAANPGTPVSAIEVKDDLEPHLSKERADALMELAEKDFPGEDDGDTFKVEDVDDSDGLS